MRKALPSLAFVVFTTTSVFAEVCCPPGCVQNGYGGCWYNATNNSCQPTTCQSQPSRGSGGQSGTGGGRTPVNPSGSGGFEGYCGKPVPPQTVAQYTAQCRKDLAVNAQRSCLVESDADRTQDAITGLSCSARKAQLVRMPTCRNLCATYAASRTF